MAKKGSVIGYLSMDGKLAEIDLVTGHQFKLNLYTRGMQGIGYNSVDRFIYGLERDSNWLLRMDHRGVIQGVGQIEQIHPSRGQYYHMGTFDKDGYFYLTGGGLDHYYVIDVNLYRPNSYLKPVNPRGNKPYVVMEEPYYIKFQQGYAVQRGIWAYNNDDDLIYTLGHSQEGEVVIAPNSGEVLGNSLAMVPQVYPEEQIYNVDVGKIKTQMNYATIEVKQIDGFGRNQWSKWGINWNNNLSQEDEQYVYRDNKECIDIESEIVIDVTEEKVGISPDFYGEKGECFRQQVNKTTLCVGDIITIKMIIENGSNIDAKEVMLTHSLAEGINFLENSVYLGNQKCSQNIQQGIQLSVIEGRKIIEVQFQAQVTKIPEQQEQIMTGFLKMVIGGETYSYQSEEIAITIERRGIQLDDIRCTVNQSQVTKGDTITYTIELTNRGICVLEDVMLNRLIVDGVALVPGSLELDGANHCYREEDLSIEWKKINPKEERTAKFSIMITDRVIEKIEPIINLQYAYHISEEKREVEESFPLPKVIVKQADLLVSKWCSCAYSLVGERIHYGIVIENPGNIIAKNVVLKDCWPEGVSEPINLLKNGNSLVGSLKQGIPLGMILPMERMEITYESDVLAVPSIAKGPCQGIVQYQADLPWEAEPRNLIATSNILAHQVAELDIRQRANIDLETIEAGQTFTYRLHVENKGDILVQQYGIVGNVFPNLQLEQIMGEHENCIGDLTEGIVLGALEPGEQLTVDIVFRAKEAQKFSQQYTIALRGFAIIQRQNDISVQRKVFKDIENKKINIIRPSLHIELICGMSYATIGDNLTYQILLHNDGDVFLESVVLQIEESMDFSFDPLNCIVDGDGKKMVEWSNGIELGSLAKGETRKIEGIGNILGKAIGVNSIRVLAVYEYQWDYDGQRRLKQQYSNYHQINVVKAEIAVSRHWNKSEVTLGDRIKHKLSILNTGEIEGTNLLLKEKLPDAVDYIPNSLLVNGEHRKLNNLIEGIRIPLLAPKEEVSIIYEGTVVGGTKKGWLSHESEIEFYYRLDNGVIGKKDKKNSYSIPSNTKTFRCFSIDEVCTIPWQEGTIEEIVNVSGIIDIGEYYLVKTISRIDSGGKGVAGYLLVVHGSVDITIEYRMNDEFEAIESVTMELPFGTSILLPSDATYGEPLEVIGEIQQIDYDRLGYWQIYTSISIDLTAKFMI